MSTALSPAQKARLTIEEFLALPDDGTERWFVDGEIRPEERTMTRRSRDHTRVEAKVAYYLGDWLLHQPAPRGIVHSGEIGFRLRRDPDVLVGTDVAYASAELVALADQELPYYDGSPTLTVEILSPSDKHKDVVDKVRLYLAAGVVVWEIDPDFQVVHVHQPGRTTEVYSVNQEIDGTSYMPGLRVPIAAIFEV